MPVISSASGSQTAVISTEHTLATKTTFGVYVLSTDLGNMASGDTTILRIKTKVRNGDTSRLVYEATYVGAQAKPNVLSRAVPVPANAEIICTLTQSAGTGRVYPWNLLVM